MALDFETGFLVGRTTTMTLMFLVVAMIASVISAFLVQFSAKIVLKFKPTYAMTYKAAFLGLVAASTAVVFADYFFNLFEKPISIPHLIFASLGILALQSGIYGYVLKGPEKSPIGQENGSAVVLLQLLLTGLLVLPFIAVGILISG